TSDFLDKAFRGARAWREGSSAPPPSEAPPALRMGKIDRPDKTFDGFTLFACASMSAPSTQAYLVNMRGDLAHRWAVPFSQVWWQPPHLGHRVKDSLVCFFDCHPYPNGDLLVVFHGLENTATGYGLAKLDK